MLDLLWIIAMAAVLLWAVGLATSATAGGLIHGLLVVAIIAIVTRMVVGRRHARSHG